LLRERKDPKDRKNVEHKKIVPRTKVEDYIINLDAVLSDPEEEGELEQ